MSYSTTNEVCQITIDLYYMYREYYNYNVTFSNLYNQLYRKKVKQQLSHWSTYNIYYAY